MRRAGDKGKGWACIHIYIYKMQSCLVTVHAYDPSYENPSRRFQFVANPYLVFLMVAQSGRLMP